jgi:hypothetical protein
MTNDDPLSAIRRVLLAAHTGSVPDESVKAARAIAAAFHAELAALFIEDPNLVRMAALPFTREIGAASGSVRPIEPADVERALRLQADRMRRSLDELVSFRVERGGFAQRVLEEISDSVAAVLTPGSRTRQLYRARAQPQSHDVMALYDDSPGGARALALGLRLSQSQAVLRVAVAAATDLEFWARQEAARSRASAAAGRVEFVRLAANHPLNLARAVRDHPCAALLLSSQSMKITPERLTLLLENLYCPLVLLG